MSLMIPVNVVEKPVETSTSVPNAEGGQTITKTVAPLVYPDVPQSFLIAANGVFRYIKNPFYTCLRRVKDPIPGLAELAEKVDIHVERIPEALFREIEAFLTDVYEKTKGEGVALLAYSPAKKEWKAIIPKQKSTGAHVSYDIEDEPIPEGFELFGTIHSHPTFSAFHSGVDDKDEFTFDGYHLTVGFVNRPNHEYACSYVIYGERVKCELHQLVAIPEPTKHTCPPGWLDKVESGGGSYGGYGGVQTTHTYGHNNWPGGGYNNSDNYFRNRTGGTASTATASTVKIDTKTAWDSLAFSDSDDAAKVAGKVEAAAKDPTRRINLIHVFSVLLSADETKMTPIQHMVADCMTDSKVAEVKTAAEAALASSTGAERLELAPVQSNGAFDAYQREATVVTARRKGKG